MARTMLLPTLASTCVLALFLAGVRAAEDSKCDKSQCNWAIWNHYEAKGCTPVYGKGGCCPDSFNCTTFEDSKVQEGCQFKGRLYHQGEVINTTNPCHTCKCGANGVSSCAVIECFSEITQPNCMPLFEHSSCCPANYYCLPSGRNTPEKTEDSTCEWEGKSYVDGQIIEIKDKPCLTCICKPGFNGPDSPSCKKVECSFPGNNLKMKRGCVPVYLQSRCCSIDWICPPPEEPEPTAPQAAEGCKFGKRMFPMGAELDLRDPCTSCKCSTPPDFTCIRKQCPGPPNDDFVNCRPMGREGQCCPEFVCVPPGSNPPPQGGRPPLPPNGVPQPPPNQAANHQGGN